MTVFLNIDEDACSLLEVLYLFADGGARLGPLW